jgi:YVTN family beta-propeller protein
MNLRWIALAAGIALTAVGCSKPQGGYRLYVTNEGSGDMTIIDSSNMEVVETVKLGKRPRGIHASPDKSTIYVALSGTPPAPPGVDESTLPPPDKSADGIGVFDVAQNKLVRTIEGGSDPENFDIAADGKILYVSNEDAAGVSFIDLASGKLTQSIRVGDEPEGVKLSPDGTFLYVTSEAESAVGVVDPKAGKLIKIFKTGRRPRSIAFMPDGKHAYINAENDASVVLVDSVKHEMIKPISLGEPGVIKPMGVLLSPDASKLFVTSGRGKKLFIIDTATNAVSTSFEVGQRPWGLTLSPDGKTLFTANGPSDDISVVDLASQTVTKKVKCGKSPWGVIALPR